MDHSQKNKAFLYHFFEFPSPPAPMKSGDFAQAKKRGRMNFPSCRVANVNFLSFTILRPFFIASSDPLCRQSPCQDQGRYSYQWPFAPQLIRWPDQCSGQSTSPAAARKSCSFRFSSQVLTQKSAGPFSAVRAFATDDTRPARSKR